MISLQLLAFVPVNEIGMCKILWSSATPVGEGKGLTREAKYEAEIKATATNLLRGTFLIL